jgi:C1A family cysteine protease
MKRPCLPFLCLLAAVVFLSIPALALGAELQEAPLNPAFLEYQEKLSQQRIAPEGAMPRGKIPSPLDLSHIQGPVFDGLQTAAFPSAYDLRNVGGKNYVTPVRNQNPYGTCWAFAVFGSLESNTLMAAGGSGTPDYSEWHMSYFAYIDQSPTMPGFGNYTTADLPGIFDLGGQDWKAVALLGRWTGAVAESAAPYNGSYPTGNEANQRILTHAYYLPSPVRGYSPVSTQDLKYAIMNYGGVSIGMYASDNMSGNISGPEWNPSTAAYYYTGSPGANHGVTAVGWDDNYSVLNFNADQRPPGNGAWIVKNSWGTGWGDKGYLYISYYDTGLEGNIAFVGASPATYAYVYQYDPLGWVNSYGYGSTTAAFANVFTAGTGRSLSEASERTASWEALKAVSFYVVSPGSTYQLQVRTDVTGDPSTGTFVYSQGGSITAPGYHTIALSEQIPLAGGTRFAVTVQLTTPGYNFPIPLESRETGYSDKASANAGESYVSSNGTAWTDLTTTAGNSHSNVALKAFTGTYAGPTPTPGGNSDDGGCSFGMAPLGILFFVPLMALRSK